MKQKYNITLLIVEDDQIILNMIVEVLKDSVKMIDTAEDGREGLCKFHSLNPDIMLSDITMPNLDGISMIQEIRKVSPNIPIVIMSSHKDTSWFIKAIELGVDKFLLKPLQFETLKDVLHKLSQQIETNRTLLAKEKILNDYKNALDASALILKFDEKGKITYCNEMLSRVSEYEPDEIIGKPFNFLHQETTSRSTSDQIWEALHKGEKWKGILECKKKNHQIFFVEMMIVPISDIHNSITEFIAIQTEITDQIFKDHLIDQLYTDHLTHLGNRPKLTKEIVENPDATLVLINMDSFKEVNNFYGNKVGDQLLIVIGEQLKQLTPNKTFQIYKLQADEFAILIPDPISDQELTELIELIQFEISHKLQIVDENQIQITCTLGIAGVSTANIETSSYHDLISRADMALKAAKRQFKPYLFFDDSISIPLEYERNVTWTKKLREAIFNNRIIAYYQPIYNNQSRKIEKFECLVRYLETDNTVIGPYAFLHIAKKSKLYSKLTRTVMNQAFNVFADLPYEFSINLSLDDIVNQQTKTAIYNKLMDYPQIASRVVFEILESEGIEKYDEVIDFIRILKKSNCKIAIDDFGSGYSNFEHILRLQVDYIKIDASLVRKCDQDYYSQIILENIVNFSQKLNIKTIAEFVHSQSVFKKINELGINYSQGFFIGEPRGEIFEFPQNHL